MGDSDEGQAGQAVSTGARERRPPAKRTQRPTPPGDAPPRRKPAREQRPPQLGARDQPDSAADRRASARPKNASQAKARAKARKAKAPKVVRPPLRERIVVKLASIELNPRALVARVPFVVLVIGSLGVGLGTTLWLSTDAAERSYQLGSARETNQALLQQKEALERDVLEAQAAPALAEAARDLGMIPSRDTAHLVQDPAGNWIVVGTPKPAEGVPPPPLNTPLPDEAPPPPPAPAPRVVDPRELTVRLPSPATPAAPLTAPPAVGPRRRASRPRRRESRPRRLPPTSLAAAPLDAGAPHLPTPAALPGPAAGAEQLIPAVAPVPGAPA